MEGRLIKVNARAGPTLPSLLSLSHLDIKKKNIELIRCVTFESIVLLYFMMRCILRLRKGIGLITVLLLTASVYNLSGQKVTVSDEIVLRTDLAYDLVGKIDSQVILFRDRGNKFEAKIFDESMRFKSDKELPLADKNCTIMATLLHDSTFYVFYGFRHRGNYYIQTDRFNGNCDKVSGDTIKIYDDILLNPSVKYTRSDDKSKILFFTAEHDRDMQLVVFDLDTRKTIFERKVVFKETDISEDFRSMIVTNEGSVIAIFEKENYRSKKDKHFLEVFQFLPGMESVQTYNIPLFKIVSFHNKFIYDNANHQLVGGGVYTQKSLNKAEGIYFIKHALKSGAEMRFNLFPFDTRFDEEISRRAKDKNEFNQLVVSDIALKEDGGALLITEIKKEYERRAAYGGAPRSFGNPYSIRSATLVDYYFEDMALFAIGKEGNLSWSDVLHKKQYSHDDDGVYSSYFLFKNPSRLRLVYNDEISTENTVSEYIVHANGQYQRKSVLSTEYVRLQLRFRDAVQISSTAFVVPSQRSTRLSLVKIEYL